MPIDGSECDALEVAGEVFDERLESARGVLPADIAGHARLKKPRLRIFDWRFYCGLHCHCVPRSPPLENLRPDRMDMDREAENRRLSGKT
jgi:hypothetical protein